MREYIAMPTRLKFLLCAVSMPFVLSAQAAFPAFRVTTMLEYGRWAASPIVVIGEVTNISSYGEQAVENLPSPMSPDTHRLYWCEGILT